MLKWLSYILNSPHMDRNCNFPVLLENIILFVKEMTTSIFTEIKGTSNPSLQIFKI